MATCQCPVCYSLVIGEGHIPIVCSNCHNQFVFPTGFQAKSIYVPQARRRCEKCNCILKFVKMVGERFRYECPNKECDYKIDFF